MTMIVVASAVPQIHAAMIMKIAKLKAMAAATAVSQSGVKKGRR
jgi:hypothetical protein